MVVKTYAQRWSMRTLGVATAAMMLAIGLVTVDSRTSASAITGSEFDPGNIISDDEFYNGSAMTEAQIQSFLNAKTGILKSLRQNVTTRPKEISKTTGNLICEEIKGGDLLASTMIYRAQVACGISAKVILVTLQKEQSLITDQYPISWNINNALGYACPDSTGCSSKNGGFGHQVYAGTRQFKAYKAAKFLRQPGVHTFEYKYKTPSCGTKTINVTNYATAALYNYTPYPPNAAALANLDKEGDSCSSYGNRNFWFFYYSWFGNPTDITPSAAVERIGGADRYAVSAALVKKNYPTSGVAQVYVTTGVNFADALSASTAAAAANAPLLLVSSTSVPASIKTELQRLAPKEIVLLGGPSVVSNEVLNVLKTMALSVSRVYGADRYETSRLIAGKSFQAVTTTSAFIATGDSFPDALSASSAAATGGGPMILVKGSASSLDAPTLDLLSSLGVTKVSIAGGPGAVSAGIESQLVSRLGDANVTRYGGATRFDTSVKINNAGFASSSTVYLATGYNFPDALSGAAIAGKLGAPLYIVHTSCVPKSVLQAVKDLGATKVVVLGGTGALDSSVALYDNCAA